jgi:hypothetical protein
MPRRDPSPLTEAERRAEIIRLRVLVLKYAAIAAAGRNTRETDP